MDKTQAIKVATEYIDLLKNSYNIKSAILSGSYAKGTNHSDSDIDIVLAKVDDIIDTQIELMKLRRKIDLRIEPNPFAYNDFNISNPVVNKILKFGINISA